MSKKDIVKYIIDEYGVTSPTDITNALKDLLGETLQDMLNSEFDEHMGYDKYDQKTDKTNYRNGTSKKHPLKVTAILTRSLGWRPIGASTTPRSSEILPWTRAQYDNRFRFLYRI